MNKLELRSLIREEIRKTLNENASSALDLSDKNLAIAIKNKLPAKYKTHTKT